MERRGRKGVLRRGKERWRRSRLHGKEGRKGGAEEG
jgi:hypothetical protein